MAGAKHQQLVRVDTPVTPPPPIPRRLMRAVKCAWQPSQDVGQDTVAAAAAGNGSVFVYPQPTNQSMEATGATVGVGVGVGVGQSALLVDLAARPTYADADGISDDDRMSLENSVFDESLTSTPVKVAGYQSGRYATGHMAKRAQRSSSSTVDSAYGSTTGAHSERFASSSTSVDFRSRFSSVDTQSSLDEKPLSISIDSPLAKDTCRLERAALNDVMHKLNNNLYANSNGSSNNNTNNNNNSSNKLPTVPARKLPQLPGKLPPPPPSHKGSHNSSSDCGKESSSSVSASASTSSAGSGSSTISSATMSSTSVSLSGGDAAAAGSAPLPPAGGGQPKRPGPPEPPLRNLNSFECMENVAKVHAPPPLTVRNKLNRNKPPPIVYPKLQQRQDSTLSSDSYSISSSPGYNSKLMETPLLASAQSARKSQAPSVLQRQPLMDLAPMRFGSGNPAAPMRGKMNFRQDSTISSDSFSQTSSPGYNSKLMEAPLLPSLSAKRLCSAPAPIVCRQGVQHEPIEELEPPQTLSPLSKCPNATPSSLQTIVRFQNGAPHTMSLQHQVRGRLNGIGSRFQLTSSPLSQIINRRKSSNPYITNGRLKFRLFQILINAFALLAIAGGLAAYFNAYPTIKFVNKTIINTIHVEDTSSFGKNPAPGTCLPIIVKFCQGPQIPYNYTVFPNYIGHFGQLETQVVNM